MRFVFVKDVSVIKEGMVNGMVDVVIGMYVLLVKNVEFKCFGLLIVDEE